MNYEEELAFAKKLALEAGEIARKYFSNDIAFEQKSDDSPVTIADTDINRLVIERINQHYPGVGILAEEESGEGSNEHQLWLCDPIDGTIPYTLGIPASTICLALVVDGVPEVGVVYDFNGGQLFSAVRGGQASLNDKPIAMSTQPPTNVVELGWYHAAAHDLSGVRERLFLDNYQVLNLASNSYMSLRVVTGKIVGVLYAGDKPWDVAAVKVIVEACGGIVTDLYGNDQRYDRSIKGAIIAHPDFHEYLLKTIGL